MQGNLMSRRNFVGAAAATAATVAAFSLTGCGSNGSSDAKSDAKEDKAETKALSGTITAVGSTALQPLCEAAAEQFMEKNSGVQITVQGGGSGQGITQITQGAVQIGNSDVFVEPKEANVEDNSWTIWAYEHMYTAADPDEATKAFIEYMMSDDVQGELVEAQGYIPVSGMKVEKDASGKVTKK